MTRLYNVDLDCPGCGVLIPNGPDRRGTIAELYEGQELPTVLVRLMTDTPWCDEVQEYVPIGDPASVHLTPKPGT